MNYIPVIGWFISLAFNISVSVPFWIIWTVFGIGQRYFYWLPATYQSIPFWHCVGLFIVIGILKHIVTPSLASVSNTNNCGDK